VAPAPSLQPEARRAVPWVMAFAAVIGAAVPAPAQGASDIVTVQWDAQGRFSHRVSARSAGFSEVCGELGAGQAVRWRFEATAPLRFNIHHHEGQAVIYSQQLEASAGSQGVLRAQRSDTYCWMWDRFPTTGASVELRLERLAPPR
jgi:hypothetical protein